MNISEYLKKEGKSLIPILKTSQVESTYALRLTPMDKYTLQDIKDFLGVFDDYVIVEETSKKLKLHYHAIIFTKLYEDEVRERIRGFLNKYFKEPPKRGDANKQYNLSETGDLELSLVYLLKDGGPITYSQNINDEYLETLKKQSYKKYSKDEFSKQLEELKKRFKTNDTRLDDMMIEVTKLKALYRQPINMTYIYQSCVSYRVHNSPDRAEEYVREFLSKRI